MAGYATEGVVKAVLGPHITIKTGHRYVTVRTVGKKELRVSINGVEGKALSDIKNGDKIKAYGAVDKVVHIIITR